MTEETHCDFHYDTQLSIIHILLLLLIPLQCPIVPCRIHKSTIQTHVNPLARNTPSTTVSLGNSSMKHFFWFASK